MRKVLICLVALLVTGIACKRSSTYRTGDGSVTVENRGKDAGSMTFTGKDGQKLTMDFGSGKLPDNYPKDVPVYKDAKVMVSQSVSEKNGRNLVLETNDSLDKVVDFYKKGLESNGWKTENTLAMGQMTMLTATKENRQVSVQVTDGDNKRSVMQILSEK